MSRKSLFIAWDGTPTSTLKDATELVHRLHEQVSTLTAERDEANATVTRLQSRLTETSTTLDCLIKNDAAALDKLTAERDAALAMLVEARVDGFEGAGGDDPRWILSVPVTDATRGESIMSMQARLTALTKKGEKRE